MVNSRSYVVPGCRTTYQPILSRFYGAEQQKSRPLSLMTRCDGHHRYPLVEGVMGDMSIQSYVHNCAVSVHHRKCWSRYIVFFKLHRRLPVNRAVSLVARSHSIRGDVAVMRVGFDGRVVNMCHGDAVVADQIVTKLAETMASVRNRNMKKTPTELMIVTTVARSRRQRKIARERRREEARAASVRGG
ncbi:hypothetical protein VTO73DRAFT_7129 [Trametes versicolor]